MDDRVTFDGVRETWIKKTGRDSFCITWAG